MNKISGQRNTVQFIPEQHCFCKKRFLLIKFLLDHRTSYFMFITRAAFGVAVTRNIGRGNVSLHYFDLFVEQRAEVDEKVGFVQSILLLGLQRCFSQMNEALIISGDRLLLPIFAVCRTFRSLQMKQNGSNCGMNIPHCEHAPM